MGSAHGWSLLLWRDDGANANRIHVKLSHSHSSQRPVFLTSTGPRFSSCYASGYSSSWPQTEVLGHEQGVKAIRTPELAHQGRQSAGRTFRHRRTERPFGERGGRLSPRFRAGGRTCVRLRWSADRSQDGR
jgi:hypothetical protein